MMEYVTPNMDILYMLDDDVITTSLNIGEETEDDSDSADNMGF